jgi:hypothetical protein
MGDTLQERARSDAAGEDRVGGATWGSGPFSGLPWLTGHAGEAVVVSALAAAGRLTVVSVVATATLTALALVGVGLLRGRRDRPARPEE